MPPDEYRDLKDEMRGLSLQVNSQNVVLAEIKALVGERHLNMKADIDEIKAKQESRPCAANTQRLVNLERWVYSVGGGVAILMIKAAIDLWPKAVH